jgi:hypothetical protein
LDLLDENSNPQPSTNPLDLKEIQSLVQEELAKYIYSPAGQTAVNDLISKQHYDTLTLEYIASLESDNLKIDPTGNYLPTTITGKKMLLQVQHFDESQDKIAQMNLWQALKSETYKELSKKYSENINYYNQNNFGKNNKLNKEFIETVQNCLNVASAKVFTNNNSFYNKEDLYLEMTPNPYEQRAAPQSMRDSLNQTFSDPDNISRIMNDMPVIHSNVNPQLTGEARIQQLYIDQRNQINAQTALQNRQEKAVYQDTSTEQPSVSGIEADLASLSPNTNNKVLPDLSSTLEF